MSTRGALGVVVAAVLLAASDATTGIMSDLVPFAADQEIDMKINGDTMSGVAEEYVSGRLMISASAHGRGANMRFEVVSKPKFGELGWNNSISGEFVYSPRSYTMPTTNHGRETDPIENSVPGCMDDCSGCPGTDTFFEHTRTATDAEKEALKDRPCVVHETAVDKDFFKFRAVNDYGMSNWAEVTIVFEDVPTSSGTLQLIMFLGWSMMLATVCGMLRVVALQAILNPGHRWTVCGKVCGGFCAPTEESTISGLSADDVKHDMYGEEDETSNPLNEADNEDEQ